MRHQIRTFIVQPLSLKTGVLACFAVQQRPPCPFFSMPPPQGLQLLLEQVGRLVPHATVMMGPPCSNWVWISRSNTKRSKVSVQGDETQAVVVKGNMIAATLSQLMKLLHGRGVFYLIEQPASSLFFEHPAVASVLKEHAPCVGRARFLMSSFGAPSAKPTLLVGTAPWMGEFQRRGPPPQQLAQRPKQDRVRLARVSADGRVTGNQQLLQASASYPPFFCAFLADKFCHTLAAHLQMRELVVKPLCARIMPNGPSLTLAEYMMTFL